MAKSLESGALSAYCEGIAMMQSAGIQTDEAVHLLSENMTEGPFRTACEKVYRSLVLGNSLAKSMNDTGAFPEYALNMISAGERAGRLENVMRNLAHYYAEEDRLFAKMRSAIVYPAALLGIMTLILLFTVVVILPVFVDVYASIAGNLSSSSYAYVNASILIGWVALIIMAVCTLIVLIALRMSRGEGRTRLIRCFEKLPVTHDAMYRLAVSRFSTALATFTSTGMDSDMAMNQALSMVDHDELRMKVTAAYQEMTDPKQAQSLSQAIYNNEIFDPINARMLLIGNRSGSIERVLQRLSGSLFDDAIIRIDALIDSVEPALAAFLTISVGATLISVMLPLIGIMGSIG